MDNKTRGHLLALFTIGVWGTTFISTKVLLVSFNAAEVMLIRFIIGYIVLFLMKPGFLKVKRGKQEGLFALAGACGVTLYFIFENFALTYTYASNVSVIISSAPLFTALLASIFIRSEGFGKSFFVGFGLAMVGIGIISFNGSVMELNPLGDILAVLGAVSWAFYSILLAKLGKYGYDKIQMSKRIFFYGIIFMIPVAFITKSTLSFTAIIRQPHILGNFLFLGVLASAVCYVTWNKALDILGPVKTSVYIYLLPVATVAASIIVLKEKITFLAFTGMAFTLLGLVLSQINFKDKKKSESSIGE